MSSAYDYLERVETARMAAQVEVAVARSYLNVADCWHDADRALAADAFDLLADCLREVGPCPVKPPRPEPDFTRFSRACIVAWRAVDAYRRAKDGAR